MPTELAHLPYQKGMTYEDYVGQRGYERIGRARWRRHVADVVGRLREALLVDYVVLGGGNVKRMDALPKGCVPGSNSNAFKGGIRIWTQKATHAPPRRGRADAAGAQCRERRRGPPQSADYDVASAFSIAWRSSGDSGVTSLGKNASTLPCLSTRYLLKFHFGRLPLWPSQA